MHWNIYLWALHKARKKNLFNLLPDFTSIQQFLHRCMMGRGLTCQFFIHMIVVKADITLWLNRTKMSIQSTWFKSFQSFWTQISFFKTWISCNHNHDWWWRILKTESPLNPPDLVIPQLNQVIPTHDSHSTKKWNVYKSKAPKGQSSFFSKIHPNFKTIFLCFDITTMIPILK